MSKPLTPTEVASAKQAALPGEVITAVNRKLVEKWSGSMARITQDELVEELVKSFPREEIFARHYLDFEETFRAAGWKVTYDSPAYNETYPANFTFERA